jgi:hypothetical protein
MGYSGHNCGKIVPTYPPPYMNTPDGQKPTPISTLGITPSNTYIREYYVMNFHPNLQLEYLKTQFDDLKPRYATVTLPYIDVQSRSETMYDKDDQNTTMLVTVLMMGVGFVFGSFATAALCYRLSNRIVATTLMTTTVHVIQSKTNCFFVKLSSTFCSVY